MFVVTVTSPERVHARHIVERHAVMIGSGPDCQIQIPGTEPLHARIVVERGEIVFVPTGIAMLGETRIQRRFELRFDQVVVIADHRIAVEYVAPRQFETSYGAIDAAERALVDAIIGAEEASRLVYADWLDDRSDPRAHLVRELESGARPNAQQLEALIPTNVRWRARVLQPQIEAGCPDRAACSGHWGGLEQRAGRADLRTCATCMKLVLYAVEPAQAREHLERNGAVVLDALALRWPGDLRS